MRNFVLCNNNTYYILRVLPFRKKVIIIAICCHLRIERKIKCAVEHGETWVADAEKVHYILSLAQKAKRCEIIGFKEVCVAGTENGIKAVIDLFS